LKKKGGIGQDAALPKNDVMQLKDGENSRSIGLSVVACDEIFI